VGYERDISTRKAVDRILRDHGVKPHYTMEFDNVETIKRAVEIGLGVAIVPRLTAEHETARGSLKMLDFQEGVFTRPLAIIYKRGRELSPAVRKFIEVLTTSQPLPKLPRGEKAGAERAPAENARPEREKAEKAAS
jgi:DNA-binding transcriptional LysR family regulator